MSKLNRILWTGLVLGIAACGDDVTVVQPPEPTPGIRSVTVAPDGITLAINATAQMTAAVVTDPGATGTPTIAWSTSSATVATVSATGLVTGKAAGSVGITATATLGTSTASGVATVNVTAQTVTPATVSISSINNAAGAPANIAALAGQANVVLNLDRGGEKVTKVALLVDNVEVWAQAFSSASAEAAPPELAVEVLTAPWNTADFNGTTGAVKWPNGEKTLTAKVTTVQNASGSASPSIKVNLANTDLLAMSLVGTKSATDNQGRKWWGGDLTATGVPVLYSGGTVGSVTLCLEGYNGGWDSPVALSHYFEDCTDDTSAPYTHTWTVEDDLPEHEGYQWGQAYGNSVVGGGQGPSGTSGYINYDNVGPDIDTDDFRMPVSSDGSNWAGAWGIDWINGNTPFSNYHDSDDDGVGKVTTKYYYTTGSLPSNCSVTGMTEAVNGKGSDVPASTTTLYLGRFVSMDALGNSNCEDMNDSDRWGVDVTAGTATAATTNPKDGVGYAALPGFAFTLTDNASGFTGTPMGIQWRRAVVAASTSSFSTFFVNSGTNKYRAQPSSFAAGAGDIGAAIPGYQQLMSGFYDQAGNWVDLGTSVFQLDPTGATVVLVQSPTSVGSTTSFQVVVSDDQDLRDMYGFVDGPVSFRGPVQTIGAFGLPYLIGNQTVTYSFNDFVKCYGAYNAVGSAVTSFSAKVRDFANAYSAASSGAIPGAILGSCSAPWTAPGGVTSSTFTVTEDADPVNEGKTITFKVALTGNGVTSPSFDNPFTRVELWIESSVANEYTKAATLSSATLSTSTTSRTYAWNIAYTAPSVSANTVYNYYIVAVNSSLMGATLNGSFTVNNVP